LHVVLREIHIDEVGERQPACNPLLAPYPLELSVEGVLGVLFRGKPAALDTLGVAAADPIAVRPERPAVRAATR
jgi:hypothetical protein